MQIQRPNLYDFLKVFAIGTMIIDHIGYFLFPEIIDFRIIGRFAFPVFLFLVGYNSNYKISKYLIFITIFVEIFYTFGQFFIYDKFIGFSILSGIILSKFILQFASKNIYLLIFTGIISAFLFSFTKQFFDYGTLTIMFACLGAISMKLKFHIISILGIILALLYHFKISVEGFSRNFESINIGNISQNFSFPISSFPGNIYSFIFVFILIFLSFLIITFKNFSLKTGINFFDKIILFISKNALNIYVFHIFFLFSLAEILKKF